MVWNESILVGNNGVLTLISRVFATNSWSPISDLIGYIGVSADWTNPRFSDF